MTDRERPYSVALRELGDVLERMDDGAIDTACRMLADAGRIGVSGCGRELLQIKGFAMRLFHLGMPVAMVGDVTMPPLGPSDVFLVTAGPGALATMEALMGIAREAGAKVLLVTAQAEGRASRLADFTLLVPAQTMADDQGPARSSVLPMGSVYEGALFVLFEVMVLKLKAVLGVQAEAMRARHTNME